MTAFGARRRPPGVRLSWAVLAAFSAIALLPAGASAPPDCGPAEGMEPLLGAGRIVLLGEIHGTDQAPTFTASVACRALADGLGVTVALELPQSEEEAVRAFVGSSAPSAPGPGAVVDLPFWAKSYQDGRTSLAMLGLIERIRDWRRGGADIDVILLDEPSSFRQRDARMAERLLAAAAADDERFFVALTGNLHNRTVPGSGRAGDRLVTALGRARVTSLNMTHGGGSAWICEATAGCGALDFGPREAPPAGRVTLFAEPDDRGYDGTYSVGKISASPPARGGD